MQKGKVVFKPRWLAIPGGLQQNTVGTLLGSSCSMCMLELSSIEHVYSCFSPQHSHSRRKMSQPYAKHFHFIKCSRYTSSMPLTILPSDQNTCGSLHWQPAFANFNFIWKRPWIRTTRFLGQVGHRDTSAGLGILIHLSTVLHPALQVVYFEDIQLWEDPNLSLRAHTLLEHLFMVYSENNSRSTIPSIPTSTRQSKQSGFLSAVKMHTANSASGSQSSEVDIYINGLYPCSPEQEENPLLWGKVSLLILASESSTESFF